VLRAGAIAICGAAALVVASEGLAGGGTVQPALSREYPPLRAVRDLGGADQPFPGPAALQAARTFARSRQGRISFAVADGSRDIAGQRFDQGYPSASLSKAMILVAYLRGHRELSRAEMARMDAMIRVSDNFSASQLFRGLGPGALLDLARRAGLRSFSVASDWGAAHVTAADQVRFFLSIDRLLLARSAREYARHLLSHIAPFHSWGIPQAARPRGWRVYFKGGWRPDGSGQLMHQAALLERGPRRVAIAVLTDGSPSERYGQETIRGIAARLLGSAARPGRLVPIKSLG